MTAQLVLQFDNTDDLLRVLQFLKDSGLGKTLTLKPKPPRKSAVSPKLDWAFGIGNLDGKLDQVNIRDYAYED